MTFPSSAQPTTEPTKRAKITMPTLYDVDSDSVPGRVYRVNLQQARCNCPATKRCKHLRSTAAYANATYKVAILGNAYIRDQETGALTDWEMAERLWCLRDARQTLEMIGHYVRVAKGRAG